MELRAARFNARLTQLDLKLLTGIHPSRISVLERGYALPRADERQRLAKALQVEEEALEFSMRSMEA